MQTRGPATSSTSGLQIEHPITGERIIFRKRASDTGGELLAMDFFVAPHGFVAAPHIHPNQTETFRVITGRLRFRIGSEERTCDAGEVAQIAPGTRHAWWNPFDEEAHLILEFRPALETEMLFQTFFGLARDRKVTSKGMPHLMQLMVLLRAYRQETELPPPFGWVLAPLTFLLAPVGRLLGYRPSYDRYSAPR